MKKMNLEAMEEINGGAEPMKVMGCIWGIIGGVLGVWGTLAAMAAVAAGGPMGALATVTVILGPTAVGAAVIACAP